MKITKQLNGSAGKYFLQELDYNIIEENKNKLVVSYGLKCNEELALIKNLRGKCTALLFINNEVKSIYNGDILFEDNYVKFIEYSEEFELDEAKKLKISVEWWMEEDYEGIEKSNIVTNIMVPRLKSYIPNISCSLENEIGSSRVFITTSVDKNVDFFEYKYNSHPWMKTSKDFYLDKEKSKNFLQVRAKQENGVDFGYSNVLQF